MEAIKENIIRITKLEWQWENVLKIVSKENAIFSFIVIQKRLHKEIIVCVLWTRLTLYKT